MRRGLSQDLSRAVRGHGGDDEVAAVERIGEIGRHPDACRKADLGQIDRIEAARWIVRGQRGIARPEMRLVADARKVHGERRSPASCSEYRDVTNDASYRATHVRRDTA